MKGLLIAAIAFVIVSAPQRFLSAHSADAIVTRQPSVLSWLEYVPRSATMAPSQGKGHGNGKKSRKAAELEYREVLLPTGTTLSLELRSRLASDASEVEDTVRARLRQPLAAEGRTVLPTGTQLVGYVTEVERSGRVSGRARIALRFTVLRHDGDEYDVRTKEIEREADSTKGKDAAKVGIGAGAGAAVGAILGGGSGAATGAAIGAAAGTGTVLATKGEDITLEVGSMLETQLTAPLRVLVRIR